MKFSSIADKLGELTGRTHKKGKAVMDIISVKNEISSAESVITRSYMAIGRKYYDMYAEGGADAEFEKQMRDIKNAKAAIKELEGQLDDIRAAK